MSDSAGDVLRDNVRRGERAGMPVLVGLQYLADRPAGCILQQRHEFPQHRLDSRSLLRLRAHRLQLLGAGLLLGVELMLLLRYSLRRL